MSNTNISPLSVTVSDELIDGVYDAFAAAEAANKARAKAGMTAAKAFDMITAAGLDMAHWTRPGNDATPEHKHGYACLQRLAFSILERRLGVDTGVILNYCFGETCEDPKAAVRFGRSPDYAARDKRGWQAAGRDVLKYVVKYDAERRAGELAECKADLRIAEKLAESDAKAHEEAEEKVTRQEAAIAGFTDKLAKAKVKLQAEPSNAKAKLDVVKHAKTLKDLQDGMPKLQKALEAAKESDANMSEHVASLKAQIAKLDTAAGRAPRQGKTWEAKEADHVRDVIDRLKKMESAPFDIPAAIDAYRAVLTVLKQDK